MRFFCYHRDRRGSVSLREELLEEHWSYMDRYATEMVARPVCTGMCCSAGGAALTADQYADVEVHNWAVGRRPE